MNEKESNIQYFFKLNTILNDIVKCLLENDNFCNLLYYDTADALNERKLSNEEKDNLLNTRLRVVPNIQFDDSVRSFVIIGFDDFSLNVDNPEFIDQTISITIYCHKDIWKLKGGKLRPFMLLNEIHKVLNYNKSFGIGRMFIGAGGLSILSPEMSGYIIKYQVINFNR